MDRFDLDQAARHLDGLAERTPAQKDITDKLMLGAQSFAGYLDESRALMQGDPAELETAFEQLDAAIAAAFRAIVAAAAPAAPVAPKS